MGQCHLANGPRLGVTRRKPDSGHTGTIRITVQAGSISWHPDAGQPLMINGPPVSAEAGNDLTGGRRRN